MKMKTATAAAKVGKKEAINQNRKENEKKQNREKEREIMRNQIKKEKKNATTTIVIRFDFFFICLIEST